MGKLQFCRAIPGSKDIFVAAAQLVIHLDGLSLIQGHAYSLQIQSCCIGRTAKRHQHLFGTHLALGIGDLHFFAISNNALNAAAKMQGNAGFDERGANNFACPFRFNRKDSICHLEQVDFYSHSGKRLGQFTANGSTAKNGNALGLFLQIKHVFVS